MARAGGKDRGLFERPAGSGVWWVRYHDQFGQEHREKVGSKAGAREVYAQRKAQVRLRKFIPEEVDRRPMTVPELVERYDEEFEANLRPSTVREYRRFGVYWSEHLRGCVLDAVTPADVEKWKAKRKRDGAAPATVNRAVSYLRRLFNLAIRDRLTANQPVPKGTMFREHNTRVRFWTPEEEMAVRQQVPDAYLWAIVQVAVRTGLRQTELFTLPVRQVNVPRRMLDLKGETTKGKHARHVEFGATAARHLQILLDHAKAKKSPWLIPHPEDPKRHDHGPRFAWHFRQWCRRAGIHDFRWHDLRHTFCSRLAMAGIHLLTIKELAGHRSISVTERYAHLAPDFRRQAADVLDDLEDRIKRPAPEPAPPSDGGAQSPESLGVAR